MIDHKAVAANEQIASLTEIFALLLVKEATLNQIGFFASIFQSTSVTQSVYSTFKHQGGYPKAEESKIYPEGPFRSSTLPLRAVWQNSQSSRCRVTLFRTLGAVKPPVTWKLNKQDSIGSGGYPGATSLRCCDNGAPVKEVTYVTFRLGCNLPIELIWVA